MNNLNVLYEDNHVIVVEKKPNVLSQSDNTGDKDMLSIIKDYIKVKYNKPGNVYLGLIHRLDRPVGGVMVFAKTSKAAARLSEQVRSHQMHKHYYAIVHGILDKQSGILENKMLKLENKKVIESDDGQVAKLEYNVLKVKNGLSLVDINLLTGRYHQIRFQFASINHPLFGDQIYGNDKNKQIALFAYKLEFIHPTTKEQMSFSLEPNYGEFLNFR